MHCPDSKKITTPTDREACEAVSIMTTGKLIYEAG
jgi:hypothetical protein